MSSEPENSSLDRSLLLAYLGFLILALLAGAVWATIGLGGSSVTIAVGVGAVAILIGTATGRARHKWVRRAGLLLILVFLLVLSAVAGRGHSYQFAWLFPAISGLLLARSEWPWWRAVASRDGASESRAG